MAPILSRFTMTPEGHQAFGLQLRADLRRQVCDNGGWSCMSSGERAGTILVVLVVVGAIACTLFYICSSKIPLTRRAAAQARHDWIGNIRQKIYQSVLRDKMAEENHGAARNSSANGASSKPTVPPSASLEWKSSSNNKGEGSKSGQSKKSQVKSKTLSKASEPPMSVADRVKAWTMSTITSPPTVLDSSAAETASITLRTHDIGTRLENLPRRCHQCQRRRLPSKFNGHHSIYCRSCDARVRLDHCTEEERAVRKLWDDSASLQRNGTFERLYKDLQDSPPHKQTSSKQHAGLAHASSARIELFSSQPSQHRRSTRSVESESSISEVPIAKPFSNEGLNSTILRQRAELALDREKIGVAMSKAKAEFETKAKISCCAPLPTVETDISNEQSPKVCRETTKSQVSTPEKQISCQQSRGENSPTRSSRSGPSRSSSNVPRGRSSHARSSSRTVIKETIEYRTTIKNDRESPDQCDNSGIQQVERFLEN